MVGVGTCKKATQEEIQKNKPLYARLYAIISAFSDQGLIDNRLAKHLMARYGNICEKRGDLIPAMTAFLQKEYTDILSRSGNDFNKLSQNIEAWQTKYPIKYNSGSRNDDATREQLEKAAMNQFPSLVPKIENKDRVLQQLRKNKNEF